MMTEKIDFLPLTQGELVLHTLDYVKSELHVNNSIALYIAGSRLRRQSDSNSGCDC